MEKIYKLIDPNTFEIMYIGKTKKDLLKRLIGHLHDTFYRQRIISDKQLWIKDLLNQSKIPIIELIEETEDKTKENYYIQKHNPKFNIIFCFNIKAKEFKENVKAIKVYQYKLDGTYIKEFQSLRKAADSVNLDSSNIYNYLIGKVKQSGGYLWSKYKEEKITSYGKKSVLQEVHQFSKDNIYIKTFSSAKEAVDFNSKAIWKCCRGETKSHKGYKFSYDINKFKI